MKKERTSKMITVKLPVETHSRLMTVAQATKQTLGQVVDDLLDTVYPEARESDTKIQAELEQLRETIQRKREQR